MVGDKVNAFFARVQLVHMFAHEICSIKSSLFAVCVPGSWNGDLVDVLHKSCP